MKAFRRLLQRQAARQALVLEVPAGLAERIGLAVGLVADLDVVMHGLRGSCGLLVLVHGGLGLTGHLDAVITHVTTLGQCLPFAQE